MAYTVEKNEIGIIIKYIIIVYFGLQFNVNIFLQGLTYKRLSDTRLLICIVQMYSILISQSYPVTLHDATLMYPRRFHCFNIVLTVSSQGSFKLILE